MREKSVATPINGIIIETPTVSIRAIAVENISKNNKYNLSRLLSKNLNL